MIVVGLVIAAVAGGVGVAGAVDAVDAVAVAVAAVVGDVGIDFDSEFGVGVPMFDIDEMVVGDEMEAATEEAEEEVSEEIVDNANGVVAIEDAEKEGLDNVVAGAAGVEVEVVGIDASERCTVDVDIDEEAEDYVGAALEKRS